MERRIPASGINLFQLIYILIREYEMRSGQSCLNLSLGNPDLIPDARILALKAKAAGTATLDAHTYAEDRNLNHFAEGMVEAFSGVRLHDRPHLRAVPIGGIKTASAILPLSCGLHLKGREKFSVVTHLPAYDVMGTWGATYLGGKRIVWPLESRHQMRMNLASLKRALSEAGVDSPDLLFVIRPGNPASAGATEAEWRELIEFCIERRIRLANDGAYATLTDGESHVTLASVAQHYTTLEWMELFSVSKSFSDPGQRLGVAVGSQNWIEDFVLIKGNTDSGPVPAGMMAYGELFQDPAMAREILSSTYQIYRKRLDFLVPELKAIGLKPACETTSGFFTLWLVPDEAFGENVADEARRRGCSKSEAFNRMVIDRTGIVGVHFTGPTLMGGTGESFIRYAVCSDVLESTFQARFREAIAQIRPHYHA